MLLGLSLSVSWICLLFSSTACFPATKGDYRYPYTVTWGSSGGSAPALQPASSPAEVQSSSSVVAASSQQMYEPGHYAAAPSPSDSDGSPGLPWVVQPAGGADGSFYDFSNWMPSQPFPDFRPWSSASASASSNEMPQTVREIPPPPPPSYIIQSRNGYMRSREVMSNTQYSPEFLEPPPFPVDAPGKTGPVTGPAGGVKV